MGTDPATFPEDLPNSFATPPIEPLIDTRELPVKRVAIILAWTSIGFVAGVAATLITLALLLSREEPKLTPTPNREHRPEIIQKKLKSMSATDCNPVGHS